jgi:hypothetical protein
VPTRDPRRLLLAALVALVPLAGAPACRPGDDHIRPPSTTGRDQGVAEHSRQVMPFDLTRATHSFAPVADGLVETVVTMAPVDPAQVDAIRGHLRHEAARFSAGDWSDPARIHGDDMPGLAEIRAGSDRITITYTDVDAGGRLIYATADPAVVDALHRWGAAQSADHGHHPGHGG